MKVHSSFILLTCSANHLIYVKNQLLDHLKAQARIGVNTSSFCFNQHQFCVDYFSRVSGVSVYILKSVLSAFKDGLVQFEHGNLGCQKDNQNTMNFVAWFQSFLETNAQSSPDENLFTVPSWVNICDLFDMYEEQSPEPRVKISTFYKLIRTKFGRNRDDPQCPLVRFSKYSSHSVCDQCKALDNVKRRATTRNQLNYANALKSKHIETYSSARKAVLSIRQLAISFPKDNIFIIIDDMDNKVRKIKELIAK